MITAKINKLIKCEYACMLNGAALDRQTDRQTNKKTDRRTKRQTTRQIHRNTQTDSQTNTQNTQTETDRQTKDKCVTYSIVNVIILDIRHEHVRRHHLSRLRDSETDISKCVGNYFKRNVRIIVVPPQNKVSLIV